MDDNNHRRVSLVSRRTRFRGGAGIGLGFMSANPVATKRALHAYLMAADAVAKDPVRGAGAMVERGFTAPETYDTILGDLRA